MALLATTSLWAEDFSVGGIYYNYLDGNNVEVTYRGSKYDSYSNEYSGSVEIPAIVNVYGTTYNVTSIGEYAFRGCSSLTSITIPESITSIEDYAFYKCSSLTFINVTENSKLISIGNYAFYECDSLTSIAIPESVTSIGVNAFKGCSGELTVNCNIPSSPSDESGAFYKSEFTKVTIGEGVTSIGDCDIIKKYSMFLKGRHSCEKKSRI